MTLPEGNKLIAEFMGLRIDQTPDKSDSWLVDINNIESIYHNVSVDDIVFHSSWDWLMPVVEKINALAIDNHGEMGVYISPCKCLIGENVHNEIVGIESYNIPLINLLWQTVVQFIQWYNENKGNG